MTELTWESLAYSLAAHLAAMEDDEHFVLYAGPPEPDDLADKYHRYVQFCAYDSGQTVRCEVVSNAYRPEHLKHSVDDLVMLRTAGWFLPSDVPTEVGDSGSPNLFMDVESDAAEFAAGAVITVLRDVWHADVHDVVTDADHLRGPRAFSLQAPTNPAKI